MRLPLRMLCAGVMLASVATVEAAPRQPNVVLILADDLGYHDVGCYGHPEIRTPVIDRLARDGIRLTSFYAGATVCTPSRMALLTGAYPARLGWTRGVVGYLMSKKVGLSPAASTMAEVFRSQGYTTAIAGKWHLGDLPKFLPQEQGFDSSLYIDKSNNQTKKLWRDGKIIEEPFDNRLLTETFTREAIRVIESASGKPFFVYVPYSAPHFPVQAHPDWKGKSAYGVYGDVVEEMDHRIGEILAALEAEKIARETIVVFLSDNGPEPSTKESKATPLRGKKWSALEGGTRVPCIIRWTGVIPPGRQSDEIIAAIDLLPTLARACDVERETYAKGSPVIDGVDVWDTLIGQECASHQRSDLLYWHGSDGFQAIRVGDWKLFLDRRDAGLRDGGSGPALFHLASDIAETKDRSAEFPDRVRSMRELAKKRLAAIESRSLSLGK